MKFRVWSKLKKSWLNSCAITDTGTLLAVFVEIDDNQHVINKVYTLDNLEPVIQQYTGLKDKNGVEIFEGDVVFNKNLSPFFVYGKTTIRNYEIVPTLDNNNLVYCLREKDGQPIYNIWEGKNVEVLGNIFENPELLTRHEKSVDDIEEEEEEESEDLGLDTCEQCGEKAWDGRICHSCGLKEI